MTGPDGRREIVLPNRVGPRLARSNIVWVCGIVAGLLLGGVVAYGLTGVGVAAAARP